MNRTDEFVLQSEDISVRVAQRGGEIRGISHPDGPNVLFRADWDTPIPASIGGSYGADDLDWLSDWRGGWQELFPNAGAPSTVMGVRLPFHGEVSRTHWQVLHQTTNELTIRVHTRLPLTINRTMRVEPGVLRIESEVTNDSGLEVPVLWGHHPAYDAVPGTRIDLPACRTIAPEGYDVAYSDLRPGEHRWPSAMAKSGAMVALDEVPAGPCERVVYLTDLAAAWYALRRPDGLGIAVAWDAEVFPHLWMWTEIGGGDFPWFGRSRVVAIEPASSWPSDGVAAARERGQGHRVPPHGSLRSWVTLRLFESSGQAVTSVGRDGSVIDG